MSEVLMVFLSLSMQMPGKVVMAGSFFILANSLITVIQPFNPVQSEILMHC
jgi:hypothetical protein